MENQIAKAFTEVVGLADQLITLSTAILVLSITFVKEIFRHPGKGDRNILLISWIGYILTIVAGIWTRMAVTGTFAEAEPVKAVEVNVRLPAGVQIMLFVIATSLFIWLAVRGINRAARDR